MINGSRVPRYLIAAQNIRHIGDYGVEENVSIEEAHKVVQWAREFLSVTRKYLGFPE